MTAKHLRLPVRAQCERGVTASYYLFPKVRKFFPGLAKIAIEAG
jgi:hypothetical protein